MRLEFVQEVNCVFDQLSSERALVIGKGYSQLLTVQIQVDRGQSVEHLARLEAVLVFILYNEVIALWSTQLLKVKVQHSSETIAKFRS